MFLCVYRGLGGGYRGAIFLVVFSKVVQGGFWKVVQEIFWKKEKKKKSVCGARF
jgi:hypothetical protein